MTKTLLTKYSTEEEVGQVLDEIRKGERSRKLLVELLSERHIIYDERPSYQMNRIKGYALASFAEAGLPDSAINFVLDELQNGRHAYMVGAAARGLRGAKRPGAHFVSFLIQAIDNLKYHDDSMDLTVFKPTWPLNDPSSGRLEILRTLQWLKGYAKAAIPELQSYLKNPYDFAPELQHEIQNTINIIEADDRELDLSCCEVEGKTSTGVSWLWKGVKTIRSIGNLEVQNQSGQLLPLEDIIDQRPTVVAFFYTRCMNPNKCTLTINKIGWLQQELIRLGLDDKVKLLAFTYDPGYDTPSKMSTFAQNRGVTLNSNAHVLRTRPEEFEILSNFFKLGVNHVASTVNQHRLELFLLDQNGIIKTSYTRLQWEVEQVADDLKKLVQRSLKNQWFSKTLNVIRQSVLPVLVVFFPKCPFCWAAYLNVFGISSLQNIPYSPWLLPVLFCLMLFNLFLLYRKAKVRNGLLPFWVSLAGTLFVVSGYMLSYQPVSFTGIGMIFIGAVLNSLSFKHWSKLNLIVQPILSKFNSISVFNTRKTKTEHNIMYKQ